MFDLKFIVFLKKWAKLTRLLYVILKYYKWMLYFTIYYSFWRFCNRIRSLCFDYYVFITFSSTNLTYRRPDNSPTSRSNTAKTSIPFPFPLRVRLEVGHWTSTLPCILILSPILVSSTATIVCRWALVCAPISLCTSKTPSRSSSTMPSRLCKIQSVASTLWPHTTVGCIQGTWCPSLHRTNNNDR